MLLLLGRDKPVFCHLNVNQSDIQQKIFTRNNISVGTPAIKPTRESYFASTMTIPQAKLPPQAVRNIQITPLKQSRPFIKEADKSVLNPGVKSKSLPVNTVTTPRTPGKGKPTIQQVKPEEREVKPAERVKPVAPEGGSTGRGEKQQIKPVEKGKPAATKGGPIGREKKPAELDESPQEDKKKQREEKPER